MNGGGETGGLRPPKRSRGMQPETDGAPQSCTWDREV
jgi:hypothetical protein